MSSVPVRPLKVLGEFKPFGLVAETLDEGGKPPSENAGDDNYDYFLFDPRVTRDRDDLSDSDDCGDCGEDELFIRGNRMIWSKGSCVHRRYTSNTSIVMACWCRMDNISEPYLCILQVDSLAIYSTAGEIVRIPLFYAIESIWPLPFGLLLQRATDGTSNYHQQFSCPNPWLNIRDLPHPSREYGSRCQHNFNFLTGSQNMMAVDSTNASSHLILKHPLEELQTIVMEDKGKLSTMRDFDEKIIWTSDIIPLVASYSKGKMQHSVWLVETVRSGCEAANGKFWASLDKFCFRSIWHGKCSQSAASKVFLATDDDGTPVICFLLQEQKGLLSVRLHTDEIDNNILADFKSHMSWSIPAVDAVPVIVTRPRVKVGLLPFADLLVLDLDNSLRLYSGKRCLCKYYLWPCNKGSAPHSMLGSSTHDIVGLTDAVGGRVNLMLNNDQMFRCSLRQNPSSALTNDCITALAEGMHPSFYNHFLTLLWGDCDFPYLSNADSSAESEWESLARIFTKLCRNSGLVTQESSKVPPKTSWEFLTNSKFHIDYCQKMCMTGLCRSDSNINVALSEQNPDTSFCAQLLLEALDSLHALYESLKLDMLRKRDLSILVPLLCNIAAFLGEANYIDHYLRDFPFLCHNFGSVHPTLHLKSPPCIFRWLETCLKRGLHFVDCKDLPQLIYKDGKSVISFARKIVSFYSLLFGSDRIGRKLSTGTYVNIASGPASNTEELTVLAMAGEGFSLQYLDLLPPGVSLALRHALDRCRESPPSGWPAAAYILVGREDLSLRCLGHANQINGNGHLPSSNLISVSAPYMLHLHPVTVTSAVCDMIGIQSGVKIEDSDSFDGPMADGMEHMFNSSTQLRYGRDLRLNEVRRLLCSAKLVAVQTSLNPSASDQDLHQAQLWQLAQRTTALPFGRGAFTLATTCTFLTEALMIPKFVLAGRLPAQQNATVNLDPNTRNILELRTWPEFHNGVAVGLKLAPHQEKVTRTWITYNKPEHPNVTHAGLLFALGLHGHLRVLSNTDVYKYLSQDHDITILGMLLGVAASHRGTMDPWVSKMLYLHIPSQHPSFFPELELPSLVQSAALMAVGILYEESAHPLTMRDLLGEIGRRSSGDNVLEREGYSVAAGAALGLVGLGLGKDALGSRNSTVDRLFQYIGCKESYNEMSASKLGRMDDCIRGIGQMDGAVVNIDVTAPGATIALALMFLKTESEEVASRLSVPQTHFRLQYVRPDFIMLRVIARNMIMWSRIAPATDWVDSQIPQIVNRGFVEVTDETNNVDDMDFEATCQAYVNIVAGACISLGLKYAGSRNKDAQELLYAYAVHLLNEIKPISLISSTNFPKGLSKYVDRCTLETCLHLIVLSLSLVMAGSGHLQTLRLLRYLRGRNSSDGHANFGIQMAISLAIGFLFLGGGMRSFSTGNSAIAALLITLYPRLPTGPNDNRCHLQAFRHLYVLASEARWVQTVDVDTGLPVYAPLEVTIGGTENHSETNFCDVAPCILPERSVLKTVRVCGPRYWPQVIDLIPECDKPWWKPGEKADPFNNGVLYVKRKIGACSYVDDPIGCQSLLSRAMHKVSDMTKPDGSISNLTCNDLLGSANIDQLISTFSANPSLIAFAQACGDLARKNSSDIDFKEFCLQVLFECVCQDRPALLQIYLSFYTTISSMADQVAGTNVFSDSIFLFNLKIAVAYDEAVVSGKLSSPRGALLQSSFIAALNKRVEDILNYCQEGSENFYYYLGTGKWPKGQSKEDERGPMLLSWYLQWFGIPPSSIVKSALQKIKPKVSAPTAVPLLHLLLPTVHVSALHEISRFHFQKK